MSILIHVLSVCYHVTPCPLQAADDSEVKGREIKQLQGELKKLEEKREAEQAAAKKEMGEQAEKRCVLSCLHGNAHCGWKLCVLCSCCQIFMIRLLSNFVLKYRR